MDHELETIFIYCSILKRERENYTANVIVTQKYALTHNMNSTSRRSYMFWSDLTAMTAGTISRAKLDGSEVTILVNSGLSSVGKGGRSP